MSKISTAQVLQVSRGVASPSAASSASDALVSVLYLTPEEWYAVPDCPRQRNTEERVKKVLRGHLKHASLTQANVAAARLPDGQLIKLDGHTRAYLWEHGLLARPERVVVTVIPAKNMDEVLEMYTHYDNSGATEHLADQLSGAMREHSVLLHSGCLSSLYASSLRQVNSLAFSDKGMDLYDIVGRWKPFLLTIDALQYGRVLAAVQTILLLSFLRYANNKQVHDVRLFWDQFFAGAKASQERCWLPSEALRHVLNMEKKKGAGSQSTDRWMRYTVLALERHMAKKLYRGKDEPRALLQDHEEFPKDLISLWVQPVRDLLCDHSLEEFSRYLIGRYSLGVSL